jgi:hypothetical protein
MAITSRASSPLFIDLPAPLTGEGEVIYYKYNNYDCNDMAEFANKV